MASETFTRRERRAGALMAEYPGDPDTFPIEKMSQVSINMIRARLAEAREAAAELQAEVA